ncbi:MAG TPA: CotH kinase family protein [Vicinamibacterales bacterium]|nr:CotH kinase family protein [Vicinamibacterales bacterium]
MLSVRWRAAGILAASVLVLQPGTAEAQTSADLFDSQVLHEIRLYINSRDLRDLRARYLENVYYTADFQWRGIRVRNVAVRVRGAASRSVTKPGLRIDFDRYVTGQRFLGLRSLVLDNLWQDASMLREVLSMAMFERMGQPASRESFCRLYVNNVLHGVYAIVEAVEPEFLARTLGENTGYLFEFHRLGVYTGEELGGHAAYKPLFEARTRRLEADTILYSPIRDLFREANHPVDAVWRERVERYVNLEAFVSYVAIEAFIAEYDGILGWMGMNNFYLYRPSDNAVHRFIPWDKDLAFEYIDYPIFERAGDNPLTRGALAFPDLRALYLDVLAQCARIALQDDWLAGEMRRLLAVIQSDALSDSLKQFSNEQFERAIEAIESFVAERPLFVLKEVAAAGGRPVE